MISQQQKRDWLDGLMAQALAAPAGERLVWTEQHQRQAQQAIEQLPLPHRRDEAWRYSRIDNLFGQHYHPLMREEHEPPEINIDDYALSDTPSYRLVFANGRCMPRLSNIQDMPGGLVLGCLSATLSTDQELIAGWYGQIADTNDELFSALNSALPHDGAFIHIAPDTRLDRPIEVIHINLDKADDYFNQSRNVVVLKEGASATLLERYIGVGSARYLHNDLTEIALCEGARLCHYRYQDQSNQGYQLANLYLSQHSHSHYQGTQLLLGGHWNRIQYHANFQHPEASCRLNGLYQVGDEQLIDTHLKLTHSAPRCTSRVNYKGIIHGRGRAVFDGHIRVDPGAQKSDAQLDNKNLLLSRDAEVDTQPQLEIYADDVKCGHGTTVGQIDPQQLFYLCSRGIDPETGRQMLCRGFAEEILETITIAELRDAVTRQMLNKLNTALGTEA